jgi:hypothetical protein
VTVAEWLLSLTYALLVSTVAKALLLLIRTVTLMRRHRTFANRRFMRRHRGEQPKHSRTTVKAYLPPLPPLAGPTPRPTQAKQAA